MYSYRVFCLVCTSCFANTSSYNLLVLINETYYIHFIHIHVDSLTAV